MTSLSTEKMGETTVCSVTARRYRFPSREGKLLFFTVLQVRQNGYPEGPQEKMAKRPPCFPSRLQITLKFHSCRATQLETSSSCSTEQLLHCTGASGISTAHIWNLSLTQNQAYYMWLVSKFHKISFKYISNYLEIKQELCTHWSLRKSSIRRWCRVEVISWGHIPVSLLNFLMLNCLSRWW